MAQAKMTLGYLSMAVISLLVINEVNACKRSASDLQCCSEINENFCYPKRKNSNNAMPECPNSYGPTFTLYTRSQTGGVVFTKTDIPSHFSNNRGTVFVVHGWQQSIDKSYLELKDELLKQDDFNVITVDWRKGSASAEYFPAAANTETIGALIGTYANALRKQPGSSPYFWCIGHSIGAHVCGYTSRTAQPLLERITGSDPAQSGFAMNNGLLCSSAKNVDVIHTDTVIGSLEPRGKVDFYPNGGQRQPGCMQMVNGTEKTNNACSHAKSLYYVTNSIRNPSCYTAVKLCSDPFNIPGSCTRLSSEEQYGVMGYNATGNRYNGNLYFVTNTTAPNCSAD